jgi:hypothetical protein
MCVQWDCVAVVDAENAQLSISTSCQLVKTSSFIVAFVHNKALADNQPGDSSIASTAPAS